MLSRYIKEKIEYEVRLTVLSNLIVQKISETYLKFTLLAQETLDNAVEI